MQLALSIKRFFNAVRTSRHCVPTDGLDANWFSGRLENKGEDLGLRCLDFRESIRITYEWRLFGSSFNWTCVGTCWNVFVSHEQKLKMMIQILSKKYRTERLTI